MEKKQSTIGTFEDLLVWQKSKRLRQSLSAFCKKLSDEEKYRLKDQIIRASRSVTANIAEGYGRFHFQENIQYCRQARGSLYELIDHLDCAKDENYLSESDFNSYRSEIINCIKLVNGYISHLKNSKANFVKDEGIDYNSSDSQITNNE